MLYSRITDWKMAGFWPYTMLLGNSMETGARLEGVMDFMDARVPGSVYADLIRNGVIEDPYFEMNSLKCEWVANRWWIYKTAVFLPEELFNGGRIYLVFKGIDYRARVYFNGSFCARHEGMFRELRIDVTGLAKPDAKNEISVIIENAPEEFAQIGYTSRTSTQKARFGYKWDFSTRLVNLGLYDDVLIEYDRGARICERSVISGKTVRVSLKTDGIAQSGLRIRASLSNGKETVWQSELDNTDGKGGFEFEVKIKNPKRWYPNGYGRQPLYDLSVELMRGETICDCFTQKTGFRTLQYEKNEGAGEDALPYTAKINGKRIYLKGMNLVPLDHMYGCVDYKRYRKLIRLAVKANVNLLRVWGGGLIEKEEFYRLCDQNGIMVWQEFIQSSSGIDNAPSNEPEFLELLSRSAESAVKEKRNHISLTFWCGGNELMDANNVPSAYDDANIARLLKICGEHDPTRLMLPTSGSGPSEWVDLKQPGRNHDVHGPWKYEGTEKHYAYYNASDSMLHSEFGNDGMANLQTLKKILSKKNLKVTTVSENNVWRHHGEWWDTYRYRDRELFGEMDDLSDYIAVSQYMQAEGLRYAIESNRRRVWRNSGSIVWQLNEPWPNTSCTCVVDYYMRPKLAYYFCRDAYEARHISLKYDKLVYRPGEDFSAEVFVHNDMRRAVFKAVCEIKSQTGETISRFESTAQVCEGSADSQGMVCARVPEGNIFYAECEIKTGEQRHKNRYMFFIVNSEEEKLAINPVKQFITNKK